MIQALRKLGYRIEPNLLNQPLQHDHDLGRIFDPALIRQTSWAPEPTLELLPMSDPLSITDDKRAGSGRVSLFDKPDRSRDRLCHPLSRSDPKWLV
jgi:hypothetical protein